MNRKEKIFQAVCELCITFPNGLTTEQIALYTNIARPNVSNYLNQFIKENKIVKSGTRPVLYSIKKENLKTIHQSANLPVPDVQKEPFQYFLGYNGSIKKQINQAKAAVMYPPHGLHTLLTGDTGVGKSLFASLMYNYAVYQNALDKNSPFIVFNCADYASNPQLLVSHIFGHVKGAFTGATRDKFGLLSEADGGMLFLDEVHRLPPEGQEMIFYFMDTGTYGLLGETQRSRKAQILLICATTEEPNSTLLSTFLRRIPIKINIPNLAERSPGDQVDLLKYLLEIEARKINCAITIDTDSAKAIIGSSFSGNVGKLKSTIQSVCAHFFIEDNNPNQLNITYDKLISDIKVGIFNLARDNDYLVGLQHALAGTITIMPDNSHSGLDLYTDIDVNKHNTPFQVYDVIDKKIQFMLEQKFSDTDINNYITSEINQYIDLSLPKKLEHVDHGLPNATLVFCQSLKNELELQLNKEFSHGFLLSLGYHLNNIIQKRTRSRTNTWIRHYRVDNLEEYESALTIKKRLYKEFDIDINDDEVVYLTILLASLVVRERDKHIHVIVATHGDMIASNMVDIAKILIAEDNISAVNMPLDIRPNQAIAQIKQTITAYSNAKGFLLLVDMGSLIQAGYLLSQECNVPVRTLDMVSTPLVIEALRRSALLDADLDDIYLSLQHFKGYGVSEHNAVVTGNKPLAVLAICSSGEGIARKLKNLLSSVLEEMNRKDIHIINLSVEEMLNTKHKITTEYQVLLSIGVINPGLDVPYISLPDFFSPKGELTFQTIIGGAFPVMVENKNPVTLTKLAEQYLQEFLTYLNPKKIVPIVMLFLQQLKEQRHFDEFGSNLLNMIVHTCVAIERSVRNETITYNKLNREAYLMSELFKIYQKANEILEDKLDVKLNDEELLFIIDMLEKE
ncbi:PRD domain-containing protein [Salmonella enterica subsp. enterica]|nr:PRD domain-containing protein [Salmonella enterica subsp. enterica]ECB7828985.1 PRD domain-containing protein [Salmonella enterica subsp. enterica serovar Jodhpur]ECP7742017.1 PRD domain-containing protein [Salmonella enterica subsp. enterica serovar Jodhpur]EEO6134283.1 PRD domain-containing protein [Salmonella enterica]EKF8261446.1 sigma 54-interacting transcriptional regulator [Salmonella enterica]